MGYLLPMRDGLGVPFLGPFFAQGGLPPEIFDDRSRGQHAILKNLGSFGVTFGALSDPFGALWSPLNPFGEASSTEKSSELPALEGIWTRSEFLTESFWSRSSILG